MGLFSKIKRGFSKLWRGVKKVFKKVLNVVGKVFNSKIGKALLTIAGIATMGTALIAGKAAFSAATQAGNGFFSSLVSGGSAVLGSLTGGLVGTAPAEAAAATAGAAGQTAGQAAKVAQVGQQAAQVADIAGAAGQVANTAVGATGGSASGGLLSKVASGVLDFAKNPIGETLKGVQNVGQNAWDAVTGNQSASLPGGISIQPPTAPGIPNLHPGALPAGMYPGAGAVGAAAPAASAAGAATPAAGGMLSKIGGGLLDFAKSEGGGQILGNVVQGYAQGRQAEEQERQAREQARRLDDRWRNFDWGQQDLAVDLGDGWNQRAQAIGRRPGLVNYQNQYGGG